MNKLPVCAAVPNYNMAGELSHLLPQLTHQNYAGIYVLDDASTDSSREVVEGFDGVTFIAGTINKGAGGNRNRMRKVAEDLGHDVLIHFLDADSVLESTEDTVGLIQEITPSEGVGCVGGLSLTSDGLPFAWNYGPRPGLHSELSARVQARIVQLMSTDPEAARSLQHRHRRLLRDRPNLFAEPARRKVYWCSEQNMVMDSRVFTRLNGFDEKLRETEILELSIRMRRSGLQTWFDPQLAARHTAGEVRNYDRRAIKSEEKRAIASTHGWLRWLLSTDRM